jgi:hypothetical protein
MTTDKIRIRRCLIRVGILDTHIARRLIAPLRRVVHPGSVLGQCLEDCACEGAMPHVRGSCESVPEVIPIGKRPNKIQFNADKSEYIHFHKGRDPIDIRIILTFTTCEGSKTVNIRPQEQFK